MAMIFVLLFFSEFVCLGVCLNVWKLGRDQRADLAATGRFGKAVAVKRPESMRTLCGHRNGKLATADVRIELTQREITVANVNWSAVDKPEENSQVWNQFANQTRQARAPLDLINNGSLSLVLLFV